MAKDEWLKARIRKRDKDIREELERRQFSFGEMADLVRDGVRLKLIEKGACEYPDSAEITTICRNDPS